MKRSRFLASLVALAGLLPAAPPVAAAGWVVLLKDTPAEDFDDDDLHQFLSAAKRTLDAEGPAEEVQWSNPATGAGGRFKELSRSTDASGRPCKRLRFGIYSKKQSEKFTTWTACRTEDGRWRLVSAP
jgi:surface antigen